MYQDNSLGHLSGYTANHRLLHQHRNMMLHGAPSSCIQMVTIQAALYHLKLVGKSGTLLVGVGLSLYHDTLTAFTDPM